MSFPIQPPHRYLQSPPTTPYLPPASQIKPDKAKKIGLVDSVVDPHALERSAIATALDAADGKHLIIVQAVIVVLVVVVVVVVVVEEYSDE